MHCQSGRSLYRARRDLSESSKQPTPVAGLVEDFPHLIAAVTVAIEPPMLELHPRPRAPEHPANPFVAGFIGDANLLDAELVAERGDRALVRLGGFTFELPHRGAAAGPVKLAIRPEAITLHAMRPDGLAFAGRILRMSYGGSNFEYTVETTLGELFVIDHTRTQPFANGAETWISFVEHSISIVPTS